MRKVVVASTGRLCFVILLFSLTGASVPAWAGDMPGDVAALVSQCYQCDHFRGEDGNSSIRPAETTKKLDPGCKGTNGRLAALKTQYTSRPPTAQLLEFDDMVE